jgi:hypothetical protein
VISEVLGEAFDVYRRLWRRSVTVAGLVFLVVGLADALSGARATLGTELVSLVLALIGTLLVQGALVEVVRDLHEGRPVAPPSEYYARTRRALGTLFGVTFLAGIGIAFGFLLVIVPGLILLARWTLVVPLVMLEGRGVGEAFSRSSALVKGKTGRVLVIAIVVGLVTAVARFVIAFAFAFLPTFWTVWVGAALGGAIAVPYEAHAFTVLYYKLTEPDRLVLPPPGPPRETWRSVWDEEPPA